MAARLRRLDPALAQLDQGISGIRMRLAADSLARADGRMLDDLEALIEQAAGRRALSIAGVLWKFQQIAGMVSAADAVLSAAERQLAASILDDLHRLSDRFD